MSESYIGLAPSYGVFEKQVIAGTTASSYPLDFDVVQSTQVLVSLDGIVQEPDYAYSVGRDSAGAMQLTLMFDGWSSRERVLAKPMTPALAAP